MMTLWLTGRPCSGKTTLGVAVTERLRNSGFKAELLDGDLIRRNLWPELGFSKEHRDENIRRFGYLAEMLARQGIVPVVSAVSPYREARERVRRDSTQFVEVYVNAPVSVCEERDVKGMYAKARAGEIPDFTGLNDPYEAPAHPDVECFTDRESVEESAAKIIRAVDGVFNRVTADVPEWMGRKKKRK
jgi:adenylyl-sulfate kinase